MRYIIYGAGAIGGIVGSKLFLAGRDVVLIARGEHLRVIQQQGLTVTAPGVRHLLPIDAVSHPSEIDFQAGDVVLLTMKSQDTAAALEDLHAVAGDRVPVVCCQNGVENERLAARRFANVYGMMILMPATYLEAGAVETLSWSVAGVGDLGRYPRGKDERAEAIARDFEASGIASIAREDIMTWKYTKLYQNVANAVEAVCGPDADTTALAQQVRAEARACFAAAGIAWTRTERFNERASAFQRATQPPVPGEGTAVRRGGSSTWQSLARGAGSSEGDYLNGEIVLLGRLHGVATPANEVFQGLTDRLARQRGEPGSVSVEEATRLVEERSAAHAAAEPEPGRWP